MPTTVLPLMEVNEKKCGWEECSLSLSLWLVVCLCMWIIHFTVSIHTHTHIQKKKKKKNTKKGVSLCFTFTDSFVFSSALLSPCFPYTLSSFFFPSSCLSVFEPWITRSVPTPKGKRLRIRTVDHLGCANSRGKTTKDSNRGPPGLCQLPREND